MYIDWSDFWSVVWLFFWVFAFVAYLCAIVFVLGDLFRDHQLGGGAKAVWLIFLIFVPFLTVLVYAIARGSGMAERSRAADSRENAPPPEDYSAPPPMKNPEGEIAQAKQLMESGVISAGEYDAIRNKALGNKY